MSKPSESATRALLARAHSPDSVNRIHSEKIYGRPFFLRPSEPRLDAREVRRHARRREEKQRGKALKPKPLSARKRKQMCLYDVPRDAQRYALFEPLHDLWLGYMREMLDKDLDNGGQGAALKLASADFHGAEIEVVRSGCVGRVGIKGIVIKDAKFVFEIITKKNKVKTVPKEGTMFRIEIPAADEAKRGDEAEAERKLVFEILGDQFLYRSADRANKKFKTHFLVNI